MLAVNDNTNQYSTLEDMLSMLVLNASNDLMRQDRHDFSVIGFGPEGEIYPFPPLPERDIIAFADHLRDIQDAFRWMNIACYAVIGEQYADIDGEITVNETPKTSLVVTLSDGKHNIQARIPIVRGEHGMVTNLMPGRQLYDVRTVFGEMLDASVKTMPISHATINPIEAVKFH